jgi:flagellar hook-associated protein 3 FlgL
MSFRVTNQMILDNVIRNFQADDQQLQVDENKVSTGQAFTKPSDAPFDAAQAVTFKQRIGLNTQLLRNLDQAQSWLNSTDSALGSIDSVLQRARQLAIQGATDTNTPSDRQKIASEIHQLLLSTVDVGNTKVGDEFIFAGTKTTTQPFLHDGSSQSPNLSGGATSPVKYTGDTGAVTRQVDQATQMKVNTDGTVLGGVMSDLAQLEFDLNNSQTRVAGKISGIDPVNGRTTGTPNTADTFSIDGVQIGTAQTISVNGVQHQVIGFAPGTSMSAIIAQINKVGPNGAGGMVKASIDQNGSFIIQSVNSQPVVIGNVDQVTTDATGNDITGGTGVPVSTGGSTPADLGLSNSTDNAIGSADVVALDKDLAQILSVRSQVGAKVNRVTSSTDRLNSLGVTLAQLDSKIEDVDMAKAVSDLATAQTTFQAALGAAAKALPPTLMDFLR